MPHNSAMASELASFVNWFRTCAPYIHAFRGRTFVVAFGGEVVDAPEFWNFVADINLLASFGIRLVLVHGSRPQIESRLKARGIESQYAGGLRITDGPALSAVIEAMGYARAQIEAALSTALPVAPVANHRLRVVGGNYVMAKPIGVVGGVNMQHTGEVRKIDDEAIRDCLATGDVVLLSAIGYSATGEVFNLALEDVATQAAIALKADKLIFLMEGDGVTDDTGEVITELYTREAMDLVKANWQSSDAKVYLPCAVRACQKGVQRAHLISRSMDGSLLMELFTRDGVGTMVTIDSLDNIRPATIDDVGGIIALIEPLEEQGVLVHRPRALLEQEIEQFFVAIHDGRIVGCAALYPFTDANKAELACLAVNPDYRREGYGERLLKVIEKTALAMGISNLFVLTTRTSHWFVERGFATAAVDDLPAKKQALYNYSRMSLVYLKALRSRESTTAKETSNGTNGSMHQTRT
jgi:amino-acid N-acetyltransferase